MSFAAWPRRYFTPGGGRPNLFYVAFGRADGPLQISASAYRCAGVPAGTEIMAYGPGQHPEQVAKFREGYLWDTLRHEEPALAAKLAAEDSCLVLRADLDDQPDLDYFRDTVGILTYLLDHGASGIYDPYMLRYWSKERWRADVFDPAAAVPREHVIILFSGDGPGTEWFHTRGLRKFGRPDLSVPFTPTRYREAIIDLLNRFIEFQAFGGVIEDAREVNLPELPAGMTCHHAGSLDDPEFNNVHIRIDWPEASGA